MSRYEESYTGTLRRAGFCLPLSGVIAYPDEKTYFKISLDYDYVPLYAQICLQDFDIAGFFASLNPPAPSCLLESLSGSENGRFSIAAYQSLSEIFAFLEKPQGISQLRNRLSSQRVAHLDLPVFTGGLIGFWSYEAGLGYVGLQGSKGNNLEHYFFMPGKVLVYDRYEKMLTAAVWRKTRNQGEDAYKQAIYDLDMTVAGAIKQSGGKKTVKKASLGKYHSGGLENEFAANISQQHFYQMVEQAQEHVTRGDIFQVVLSCRWHKKSAAQPGQVYLKLRELNPSPYMFYFKGLGFVLMGASPEMQVKVQGSLVKTRPIAGTRKVSGDISEDKRLEQELREDQKEVAEHLMLVDLGRNDVGKISQPGSVKLAEFMQLERYSHVVHLVSTVEGILKEGYDALDGFQACFPAGTLSGAPKRKAMEIIDQLEKEPRGPYGGAVGYISFDGCLDCCICIRAILYRNGSYYLQAGAGIVADSRPELEHKETLNKARALMLAIKEAEAEL